MAYLRKMRYNQQSEPPHIYTYEPGVAGLIPGFSQSVGLDFKPLPRLLRRFETRTTAG